MTTEEIISKVNEILNKNLPAKAFKTVYDRSKFNSFCDGPTLFIGFAAAEYSIHKVDNQRPQYCSLELEIKTMELTVLNSMYSGQSVNVEPEDKYHAMSRVKIPFRRPKPELDKVFAAIEKFCQNWVKALKENKDRLMYSSKHKDIFGQFVDYDELLGS